MNARTSFYIIFTVGIGCLVLVSQLMPIFQGAPLLLFLVVPILNVIASSSVCPNCSKPVYGAVKYYKAVFNGMCSDCENKEI